MNDGLGKSAEQKIREWLDRPEDGYCFDRIPDSMTGFYGSKNICDFICYKYPNMWYIESKATWNDRFDFKMITDFQRENMLKKSDISGVVSIIIVLFASYQRAFMIDIREIQRLMDEGKMSINIKKIDSWSLQCSEIPTVFSRKKLLDYTGDLELVYHHTLNGEVTQEPTD